MLVPLTLCIAPLYCVDSGGQLEWGRDCADFNNNITRLMSRHEVPGLEHKKEGGLNQRPLFKVGLMLIAIRAERLKMEYCYRHTWRPIIVCMKCQMHYSSLCFCRRRLVFWGNSGGQLYTASFQNRTKLTNVTVQQVIHGGGFFDPKVIGM